MRLQLKTSVYKFILVKKMAYRGVDWCILACTGVSSRTQVDKGRIQLSRPKKREITGV